MAGPEFRGIPIAPLTGVLDCRSSPDSMPASSWRMRKNLQVVGQGKVRRGCGWSKLRTKANYGNTDFHDQLLTFTAGVPRQPITLLYQAESSLGSRSLIVAKQGAIARTNEHAGTQQILGTGFGGSQTTSATAPRFKVAGNGDYLIFTNDFDKPKYHVLEASPVDSAPLLQDIPDLETIGLSRAKHVWEWKDVIFFADVEMDGERFPNRIIWSDFQGPISFDPANVGSIAGLFDLYTNERILGGKRLGNSFWIYTTLGIWQMDAVGGERSFAFARRYNAEENKGQGVLKYPNTLIATDEVHAYMAEDGIYIWSPYHGKPQRPEWLHRSSSILYDNLDTSQCEVHIAGFFANEAYFSVKRNGAAHDCPDITLRVHLKYEYADVQDFGWTAICNYASYNVPTIRDFIIEHAICNLAGLAAAGYPYVNESLPRPLPVSAAAFVPQSIYTSEPRVDGDITVEDYTNVSSDSNSLCALLAGEILDETCRKCVGPVLFVGAASDDWCLKEIGSVFYRERCVNPSAVGSTDSNGYNTAIGSYVQDPYDSILVPAPIYHVSKSLVELSEVKMDYLAVAQANPAMASFRAGLSAQTADPNNNDLPLIVWHQHSAQALKVLSKLTMAEHLAKNTIPSLDFSWVVYRVAKVIYLEIKVAGIGGDSLFSKLISEVRLAQAQF